MKTMFLIAAMFLFTSFSVFAEDEMTCETIHILATSVMKARQSGVSQRVMHANVDKSDLSVTGKNGAHTMVDLAYKVKRYNGPMSQQYAIDEFADGWLRDCLRVQQ